MSDRPMTFADLMPRDEVQEIKSLREFLREERVRENRSQKDVNMWNNSIRRGGAGGQFTI